MNHRPWYEFPGRFSRAALLAVTALAAWACSAPARAQDADTVRTTSFTVQGKVSGVSRDQVTVDLSGAQKIVDVRQVVTITFGGEPSDLTLARMNAGAHQDRRALDSLEKIDVAAIRRDEVRRDVEFYKALCKANLAMGGDGSIRDAGNLMLDFVQKNPNSHHYYQACEVLGGLLVEVGNYAVAEKYYGEIAKAPWEDFRLRARRLVGQTQLAQKDFAKAIATFDQVSAAAASDADSNHQKMLARIGKALGLAETNQSKQAVQMLQAIVKDVDDGQLEYFALAYNALGKCYEKAGQPHDAILAYLHVDILCAQLPGPHAEALASLVPLWREVGDVERSDETLARLKQLYPNAAARNSR